MQNLTKPLCVEQIPELYRCMDEDDEFSNCIISMDRTYPEDAEIYFGERFNPVNRADIYPDEMTNVVQYQYTLSIQIEMIQDSELHIAVYSYADAGTPNHNSNYFSSVCTYRENWILDSNTDYTVPFDDEAYWFQQELALPLAGKILPYHIIRNAVSVLLKNMKQFSALKSADTFTVFRTHDEALDK